jgi:hypothetical protein
MLIRKAAIVAALAALSLLALSAPASASTAIRTDPGGALLTGSTTLTNTSSTPFIYTMAALGTITCNQVSFDADLSSRSSATSLGGSLTALTFTSCTDTIPVLTYTSCHLHGQVPTVSILASNDTGGVFTFSDSILRCGISGSATNACFYTFATALGLGSNAASTVVFNNVALSAVGTSGSLGAACGTSGSASWTLNHIVQGGTNRTVTVTTT